MSATSTTPLAARLVRWRALARLALWWEALWPAAWPVLAVLGVGLVPALLGLPLLLPAWLHLLLLLAWLGLLGWTGWRAWRGFRAPDAASAERRLEEESGLRHRPLAALADRPVTDDPAALALWRAHQRRAAAQLGRLRVGLPRPGLAARDRHALRGGLLLAVLAALVVAGPETPERLRRALLPGFAPPAAPPALRLEGWITPPAYTGAAPVLLEPRGGEVTVPAGSRLQLALSGGAGGAPELVQDGAATPFRALDGASFGVEAVLERGGTLAVRRDGGEVARWTVAVQADSAPAVAFTEPPGRARTGLALRLPWRAEDDWGVTALRAELRLVRRASAPPLVLALPLPGGAPKQARGAAQPDLSAHPWAGLEVTLRLVARDGAGQEGESETVTLALPERSFNHPVARALVALRKALSLDPDGRAPARRELDQIAAAPEAFENDTATFLALRIARFRLQRDLRPEAVPEVQALLWDTALALEEGRADRTGRALAAAREAVREALNQPPGETPEARAQQQAELQRRIEQLREAVRRHLEALAERLRQENAEAQPYDPQARNLDQREIDRRAQRMQDAAREGRNEDAQRELAELEEMLQALQEGRVARMQNPQRQGQRERGQQQMGAVQDMVRRQGEMLDRAQRRADADEQRRAQERRELGRYPGLRPPPGEGRQGGPQQGEQGSGGRPDAPRDAQADTRRDARTQRALRRALGELMQQYGDLTGEVPESLGRADQAMRQAQEALGQGDDPREAQGRALRALQEGGRDMAGRMRQQFGLSQDGDGEGEGEPQDAAGDPQRGGEGGEQARERGEGRDPLGRRGREAAGAADNGADTRMPDEAELLRTRRLQEELRRRGAERERPPEELNYIDRLLRQF
ncbi:TIGR02302 family protein [Roseomonas sp. NAR14]|uniref:TIGR02302 family protein n=1 Tax=Roseomonas acroporae TaxID=2937791 RepID=A0A9X1Y8I4_9PROT|nr:TIGR02302 family protein [Roseomonas acroporae]MCK8785889.1 TIGR02302 family protein [Roseomonas acroporae]